MRHFPVETTDFPDDAAGPNPRVRRLICPFVFFGRFVVSPAFPD